MSLVASTRTYGRPTAGIETICDCVGGGGGGGCNPGRRARTKDGSPRRVEFRGVKTGENGGGAVGLALGWKRTRLAASVFHFWPLAKQ